MDQLQLALPPQQSGALIEKVTDKVRSLAANIPQFIGDGSGLPADTKKLQIDVQAYKQSIEGENMQAEHEVAQARAEHVMETSTTTHEIKDNVESTTRIIKTRRVVQTVTATKTRILAVGPITAEMISSIDDMFSTVPLLDSTAFSLKLDRNSDDKGITITQRVFRPLALDGGTNDFNDSSEITAPNRSLIFIPRQAIPYRQLTVPEPEDNKKRNDTKPQRPDVANKSEDFVLEIRRKEGLRTLWQETAPIKANRIAERLTRNEVELQENLFELLTSEASYGHSLSIVLKHLFNVDCASSSGVVVRSDNNTSNSSANGGLVSDHTPKPSEAVLAIDFEKLVKQLDRKALLLNLDELHRYSISLLDSLKKCWINDSCMMRPSFVQLIADKLSDATFRSSYLSYLRDLRYQQDLLRELLSCRRSADLNQSNGVLSAAPASDSGVSVSGNNSDDEHLCIAERYTRVELEKIRALLTEFHSLKCVENRTLQSFLLLPLERLTKLKMCLESCEKLTRKLLDFSGGNTAATSVLAQFGIDLEETRQVLRNAVDACCSLLDESNKMTYTCMQAEAQLQLDRLVRFEQTFGVHRISLVRTDRLFLKDDSGFLIRFIEQRAGAVDQSSRKTSKAAISQTATSFRSDSLAVRLFLFSDLLLLTVDSNRRDEALAHFGLAVSAARDAKGNGNFINRLRKSMGKRSESDASTRKGANGPAAGKFACGTADLARAIAGTGSLTVLDYAFITGNSVRAALINTDGSFHTETFPPLRVEGHVSSSSLKPEKAAATSLSSRSGSKKLHRSQSAVPETLNGQVQRRCSSAVRSASAIGADGQRLDLDSTIRKFCDQQMQKEASSQAVPTRQTRLHNRNLLRISLLENGNGERAEYAFRFANESDAPRWFDALKLAISNRQVGQQKPDAACLHLAESETSNGDGDGEAVDPTPFNVLRPHNASYGEELELIKGDKVTVKKRTSDGWCKGALIDNSRSGWFRSACIE